MCPCACHTQIPELVTDQDAWLEAELADAGRSEGQHIVIFQHIPWFLRSPGEEDDIYFNIPTPTRRKMLDKFKAAGIRAGVHTCVLQIDP